MKHKELTMRKAIEGELKNQKQGRYFDTLIDFIALECNDNTCDVQSRHFLYS